MTAASSESPYEQFVDVAIVAKAPSPRKLDASFFTLSLVSGMIVGFFTLFSTLGVNAMIAMVWSIDNKVPILVCNALWMATNSAFAVIMLSMITRFVPDEDDRSHMEYRFVVGGIFGVGAGWAVVDSVLGLSMTDAMPFWCALAVLFTCLSVANRRLTKVADDESEVVALV